MSTSAFAQRNPPRSLWLQLVHRTGCLARRARPLKLTSFPYKINRRSRGRQDAIDFVTIALPSLRSLRNSHRRVSSSCYITSPAWRLRNRMPRILVLRTQGSRRGAQRTKANNCNNLRLEQWGLCATSSALICSPPCGSSSVFEWADSVYQYALNECSASKYHGF